MPERREPHFGPTAATGGCTTCRFSVAAVPGRADAHGFAASTAVRCVLGDTTRRNDQGCQAWRSRDSSPTASA